MIIIWITVGFSGALVGFLACRVAAFADRDLRKMALVFGALLTCFLLSPLVRIPLQHLFPTPTWRLFDAYGFASVFASALFGTCLLYMLAKILKLRSSSGSSRKGG